ncbi:hypothetical protein BDV27DRAFT_123625 [Aspergillus caelatus]|uniref:Rhodopsin domain-containing protein n=2 Tax=Aspergillus subgen. Circumdati TaxID=2720871 RepID=A0A5N7AG74_9EURO|nr:uncharacterized protein BDV27DRAFT_123625 [Aspergillus caelatus]KAE8367630.1 hypothetical protein BDV27DRAFT_123625 [Aspergillus caelatus]KAE8411216.1 hypothetical protein BDV36DRAFT_97093 [Aspergillus pseudocaelatus]
MALEQLFERDDAKPIDRTVQKWNTATQSLCIAAMTLFFLMRAYTRVFLLNGFNKEDWTCLGAWLLGVCYSVIALIMGAHGGGLHIDDVSPHDQVVFQKTVYVTMVMYGPTAYLTKVSLLWIMTRVFSPFRKAVTFIYIFLGVMLAYYIPAVIVKIRICDPISKFWAPDHPGTCLNQRSIIMADAVVSVVSDLIILLVPLPLTLGLQLPTKKKMRVMGILGAGGLAVASSIIRLILIVYTGQSEDGTMAFMRINMFGNAEIAIGVICACLPALSAILSRVYHEYSNSNKATGGTSGHELSKMKNQSRSMKTDKSRSRMSYLEMTSDQDVLMHNAQSEPKVETTVHGDRNYYGSENPGGSLAIFKTVDVETSVTRRE